MAASERVSVLVFVSGWRQAGACLVQRHAFLAYRLHTFRITLPAPR